MKDVIDLEKRCLEKLEVIKKNSSCIKKKGKQ